MDLFKMKGSSVSEDLNTLRLEKDEQEDTKTRIIRSVTTLVQSLWPPVALSLALLFCWEGYVRLAHVDPLTLPSPSRLFSASLQNLLNSLCIFSQRFLKLPLALLYRWRQGLLLHCFWI